MDYNKTLNLPMTDFPMKANLSKKEPEILKYWEEIHIYEKTLNRREGADKFILHDGPPYANGDIHLGHTLNKVLKDIVVKYMTMKGYAAPYVPGWDTHGLPIEQQAIKKLGIKRHETSPVEFRKLCRDYALSQVEKQKEQFKRLGIRGDWEHPYLTLDPHFEAEQIRIFGEMAKKGYIYKGLKPVYWCPTCETALAEAEIEYADHKSDAIYVKFRVTDDKGLFKPYVENLDDVYFVIWTTTTWTLPANLAICLNPEFEYSLVKFGEEVYVLAHDMIDMVVKDAELPQEYEILANFKGRDLEGIQTRHPLIERNSVIILGDHVTNDAGTGCVHTAPGHGEEDFIVGMKYGLEVLNPVDDRGYFTEKAGKYEGLYYEKANSVIQEDLKKVNALLFKNTLKHSYPHCWRCKNPIIFRATEQWFASIDGFRDEALKAIDSVRWIPQWGQERISNMIKDRHDWCISRQRIWGIPIPIFYCKQCGKAIINDRTIEAVAKLFEKRGSDAWFEMEASEILPGDVKCECGSRDFRKETDIMDVWFDSGSSHRAVLEHTPGLRWPADLYLEGSDQHRGWFQSSLLTSVATRGIAPYRSVLTHGFVVDGQGRKMSKSLGNGIDPMEVIEKYGADVLRLWTVSADYTSDMRISENILKQMTEVYRKIRNTARFILGNLFDFRYEENKVDYENMYEIDRWALLRVNKLVEKVTGFYDNYEFYSIFHAIHNFCVVDMSNFYLDIIKDRLYTYKPDSTGRRSAQTAIYIILDKLVKMIAPILTFTAEEIWKFMREIGPDKYESVQMCDWPVYEDRYNDEELEKRWNFLISFRDEVTKALEEARVNKVIGHSLNAQVDIYPDESEYELLKRYEDQLSTIFIVSKVVLHQPMEGTDRKVVVSTAPGEKCERCWMYSETVGQNPEHPTICARCVENIS
ncbi:Isoleucyl-tRNA synthetase [Caldanaerobius fijiensis DSM 17918]|uniref:Isoleucine--tRNA ligase n=1 Tax=Caldanaerobius fijiensis DSM 17918 TaxID=1121256 RepID=A0A1M4SYK4_9THEO|nr:isoleucine--tRNA ligase [Caldanaerobius fijiensis]SHE37281.1 Isoleucyl-tRNA synthetase [Caldanaerobius fijiensis DSM 17918]